MGGRARNGVPSGLRLDFNADTGLYDTTECGVTYCLPFSLMNDLKKQYGRSFDSVADWYNGLDKIDKKAVKRLGLSDDIEHFNDGFHAD